MFKIDLIPVMHAETNKKYFEVISIEGPQKEDLPNAYYRDWETDRKSTRLNSSHSAKSRMPSSA